MATVDDEDAQREHTAITRGDADPYATEISRRAGLYLLTDEEQQAIAERRDQVQRFKVLGMTDAAIAKRVGVPRKVIAEDLIAVKAANKRRFKNVTPREIAAQMEAGHDYVIGRAVEIAEEAREEGGDLNAANEVRDAAKDREMKALALVNTGLKDKLNALAKCGLVHDEPEKTAEQKAHEDERKKFTEDARKALIDGLMRGLLGNANAPIPVEIERVDVVDAETVEDAQEDGGTANE